MTLNITDYQDFTPEEQARHNLKVLSQLEQIDPAYARMKQDWLDAMNAMTAPPDPLREKAERELKQEILSAVATSGNSQVSLQQIARWNSLPVDVVETIAQQLAADYMGRDLERLEFENIAQQIQRIEAEEKDAGVREWKLTRLARRFKTTMRQMMDCFNKALCQQQPVKPKTVAEFRAESGGDPEWLIPGWIVKGTTLLLHADGGVGKTLFAYQLMQSVLQGTPWNGYPVDKGSVLLVQVDEPSLVTAERIDIRGINDSDPLYILSDWQAESLDNLRAYVAETRPALVIVDSLTAINRNCCFSENDTEYARPLLHLAALGNEYGCTVLIIHHSNAAGKSRGTTAIRNSVSEVWALSAIGSERRLEIEKTRLGRAPGRFRFVFDEDDFSFHYLGEERGDDIDDTRTQEERIRLWLSDDDNRGVAYAGVEVAERMGIAKDSVRRSLCELWAKRLIRRKRPKGSRAYLYYFADDTKLRTDHENVPSDQTDHAASDHTFPIQGMALGASDQSDHEKQKNNTRQNAKNDDQFDHLITSSAVSNDQHESQRSATTPLFDPPVITCDDHLITSERDCVKKDDTVLIVGSAVWCRSGSDKLPWKEVPQSQRSTSHIPINVLGEPIFHELMEGGKVIEVMGSGRVKVRNPRTGRTSVFAIEHCRVLRKG